VKKGELPFFFKILFLPSAHGKRSLRSLCASKEVYTGEAGDAIAPGRPASFAVHYKTRGAMPD